MTIQPQHRAHHHLFTHPSACRLGAYHGFGVIMVVRSPPAGGELDKRMHHHWWSSRPEHALLDTKVTVGGHRLPTPQRENESNSVILQVLCLVRNRFPRTGGVEPLAFFSKTYPLTEEQITEIEDGGEPDNAEQEEKFFEAWRVALDEIGIDLNDIEVSIP